MFGMAADLINLDRLPQLLLYIKLWYIYYIRYSIPAYLFPPYVLHTKNYETGIVMLLAKNIKSILCITV